MRHGKKINHLSRKKGHRRALLANLSNSLIMHKRIQTTTAKAKALRRYIEPLITKAKTNTTHNRRVVFSYLQNKEAAKELFDEVSKKVGDRPGGYTRIVRLGNRLGDNAEIAIIELVDYNDTYVNNSSSSAAGEKKKKTRRGKKKAEDTAKPVVEEAVAEVEDAVKDVEQVATNDATGDQSSDADENKEDKA